MNLLDNECVQLIKCSSKEFLYYSSFNKAAKYLGISYQSLISSYLNKNGWKLYTNNGITEPIRIKIVEITDENRNLINLTI